MADERKPIIDRADLEEQYDGDMELLGEVAEVFKQDYPRRLAEARRAITNRDSEQLTRSAHSIKGAASTLAGRACQQAAHILERLGRQAQFDLAPGALQRLEGEVERLLQALESVE